LNHVAMERQAAGGAEDPAMKRIEDDYKRILRLQFDDDESLNVLALARQEQTRNLFDALEKLLRQKPDDLVDFRFVDVTLGKTDEFVTQFLATLTTYLVQGTDANTATTWFQPLLTRPLVDAEGGRTPAAVIGERRPIYSLEQKRVKDLFAD